MSLILEIVGWIVFVIVTFCAVLIGSSMGAAKRDLLSGYSSDDTLFFYLCPCIISAAIVSKILFIESIWRAIGIWLFVGLALGYVLERNKYFREYFQMGFDLLYPKWKYSDSMIRKAAVEKLENQSILADIAKNDSNSSVRAAAVMKLEDQRILTDIAKIDSDSSVRVAAVMKLEDQSILADIVKNDIKAFIHAAEVEGLEDQSILADIAKIDSDGIVRAAAVEKLEDQRVLADIAKIDSDGIVRAAAVQKLIDYILRVDINMITKDLNDPFILCRVAAGLRQKFEDDTNLNKAKELFILAIQKDPNYWMGHFGLGELLLIHASRRTNDKTLIAQSFSELKQAAELQPDQPEPHLQLAGLAGELAGSDFLTRKQAYLKAISCTRPETDGLYPKRTQSWGYWQFAIASAEHGQPTVAVEAFCRAIELNDDLAGKYMPAPSQANQCWQDALRKLGRTKWFEQFYRF